MLGQLRQLLLWVILLEFHVFHFDLTIVLFEFPFEERIATRGEGGLAWFAAPQLKGNNFKESLLSDGAIGVGWVLDGFSKR